MTGKTCTRCNKPKGKGKHYVTVKVADSMVRYEIRTCSECGNILSTEISNLINKWSRGKETELKALVKSVIDILEQALKISTHFLDIGLEDAEKLFARLSEGYANA